MRYTKVLFDLDGTLTDPAIGITDSIMYALKKFGMSVNDRSELYRFIGPPLLESFEKFCGLSHDDARLAVKYYREYYSVDGMFENSVYEGMDNMLYKLKHAGCDLYVATSKPEVYAVEILEHYGLAKYFTHIAGSELDGTRVKKEDVIEYSLGLNNIDDLENTVMIGDRKYDIVGAKKCGLKSIGVLFGYGSRQELEDAGADALAATVDEIQAIILG